MGDDHRYPVAVKCNQGTEILKEFKNKVQAYFQSKTKSDGGECEIRDTDCSQGYILIHFKEEEAQLRVLQRNPHRITVKDKSCFEFSVLPLRDVIPQHVGRDPSLEQARDLGATGTSDDTATRKRKSPSLPHHNSVDDEPKRHIDDSTAEPVRSNGSNDVSTYDMKDLNSAEPRSPTREDYNQTQRNTLSGHISREEHRENHAVANPEIFMEVTAKLQKEMFPMAMQKEIKAKIPSLAITYEQDIVMVSGTFHDIGAMYQCFQRKVKEEVGAEGSSDTASGESSTDGQEDQVCFPSALYEYIMEIYKNEMNNIEKRYGVKTQHRSMPDGSTYVQFIPQGSDSKPEIAKESFTDKVQKVMGDWSQEKVDPSVVPLTFSDLQHQVASRFSNILVIQDGDTGIILRGPRDELSQAMKAIKKDYKAARPRKVVTITSNVRTEIPVDRRHLDILRKLKYKEIRDIEQKYNVNMEERMKDGGVVVTFRAVNLPPDLSPHASHSFSTLLQKTFHNIEEKIISVKPEFQEERVSILQEQLMMRGVDIVMEYFSGSVRLIGHPIHVAFVVEILNGSQNPGGGQAAASPEEPMDTNHSSANGQEAEEPDKCPVCQDEITDKVILDKCKHAYCKECLQQLMAHKPVCAICGVAYGTVRGNQPDGTMTDRRSSHHLPGYSGYGTIAIHYSIPGGIQQGNHPHPGRNFTGTSRTAYLPDNQEGRDILRLLKKAFDRRLVFTVGDSRTSGLTDTVTWNDIHHKTSRTGGPQCFGYPDADYLKRVREELRAKGVE